MKKSLSVCGIALMLITTSLLSSCEPMQSMLTLDVPVHYGAPQKEKTFATKYYLCQTKYIMPNSGDGVYVAREKKSCSPWERMRLPSFAEYQQNPVAWRQWHQLFGGQYRILGIVDTQTHYHITKIINNRFKQIQYLTVDSGPLTGTTAEIHI